MGSQILSTRIPNEMAETINEIARERHRKPGTVVREAIEFYLEHWADYKVAMDRMKDPADPIVNEADMLRDIDWES